MFTKLEKSRSYCEKLQNCLEKKIHECHILKKESKQNSVRKAQLEKKVVEQKLELSQYKDNADKKTTETLISLNKENETVRFLLRLRRFAISWKHFLYNFFLLLQLRMKIKKLEEENEEAKCMISRLTRDLDQLKLTHSQILVENTKLTNIKLRLEQEFRKSESRYEVTVRTLQDKFHKEVIL